MSTHQIKQKGTRNNSYNNDHKSHGNTKTNETHCNNCWKADMGTLSPSEINSKSKPNDKPNAYKNNETNHILFSFLYKYDVSEKFALAVFASI